MHAHHDQAGVNCTDAKLYFWTIFNFFLSKWDLDPLPTSTLFLDFWNFFNFAQPLTPAMYACMSICMSVCVSVSVSVCMSACLFASMSACL